MQNAEQHSARGEYGFRFAHYPILEAIREGWDPGGAHEILLEHLNTPDFLDLVRKVTGVEGLVKADGQATLFAPGHYLGRHNDSHVAEGWEVAYVLNLARDDWHPDWGGYLLFLGKMTPEKGAHRALEAAFKAGHMTKEHKVSGTRY